MKRKPTNIERRRRARFLLRKHFGIDVQCMDSREFTKRWNQVCNLPDVTPEAVRSIFPFTEAEA